MYHPDWRKVWLPLLAAGIFFATGCITDAQGIARKVQVTGIVTDEKGHPLPGVFVFPQPIGKTSGPIPEIAIYTDLNGKFVWHVPLGRYLFLFQKQGYDLMHLPVSASNGKRKVILNVQLKKST
jgi:hypothetical protein